MGYQDLTPEQKAKAAACKTPEEIHALAQAEGYELSDEELEAISGGNLWEDLLEGYNTCNDMARNL